MERQLLGGADAPGIAGLEPEYELLEELGRGGMAVVFRARERVLGREVAVKLIREPWVCDRDVLARFEREARLAARLEHPNVVRVHTVRRLGDGLALVMQFVRGRTLKDEVLADGPLPAERAERVLREVGAALACAHAAGIVHRDVKPQNILIDEADGRALLADFGVARQLAGEPQLTLGAAALGTPTYMSPEQIDGGTVDARSDIYSLGLVAWEMLAGEAPWEGESLYAILHLQKTAALAPLRRVRPALPAPLRAVVEGALHKDPASRWPSVGRMLERLDGADDRWWRDRARLAAERLRRAWSAAGIRGWNDGGRNGADGARDATAADPDAPAAPTVRVAPAPEREARRRLADWLELRGMMDRRTLADAGPGRHPRWAQYPRGADDHATLLLALDGDGPRAAVLMETYGALEVLRQDGAGGVVRRTAGAVTAAAAARLLRGLADAERA